MKSEEVAINPDQLFHRVIFMSQGTNNLKPYFNHEVSPYPLSLFTNNQMLRKGTKSSIMKIFEKLNESEEVFESLTSNMYVVDGGYFLHRIFWPKNETYGEIIERYVENVVKKYGKDCHLVFDGYPDYPTTEGLEHVRRSKRTLRELKFTLNMQCTTNQSKFFPNPKHKSQFIMLLVQKLHEETTSTFL